MSHLVCADAAVTSPPASRTPTSQKRVTIMVIATLHKDREKPPRLGPAFEV